MGINAARSHPEKQQQIGQHAHPDVEQHIHQGILGKPAAPEGKDEVADQRDAAQNRNDQIHTVAGVAVKPVGVDQQCREEQQQQEHLSRTVITPAQHTAQHQQPGNDPDQQQQALMAVGFRHQQKVDGPHHHGGAQSQESHDFEQKAEPPHPRGHLGPPGGLVGTGEPVLAQRTVAGVAAHLDMTMGTGFHFSTSVA